MMHSILAYTCTIGTNGDGDRPRGPCVQGGSDTAGAGVKDTRAISHSRRWLFSGTCSCEEATLSVDEPIRPISIAWRRSDVVNEEEKSITSSTLMERGGNTNESSAAGKVTFCLCLVSFFFYSSARGA